MAKGISYFYGKSVADRIDDVYDRLTSFSDAVDNFIDRYVPSTADLLDMDIDPADRYLCS